jgi:hypothetical protein
MAAVGHLVWVLSKIETTMPAPPVMLDWPRNTVPSGARRPRHTVRGLCTTSCEGREGWREGVSVHAAGLVTRGMGVVHAWLWRTHARGLGKGGIVRGGLEGAYAPRRAS